MRHQVFYFHWLILSVVVVLSLGGCGKRDTTTSMCLSGGNECGTQYISTDNNTSNTETPVTAADPMRCSIVATPTQVDVDQAVTFLVLATGATGAIAVRDSANTLIAASSSSNASFYKYFGLEVAGTVIQDSLSVTDSKNQVAYCSYQLSVRAPIVVQNPIDPTPTTPPLSCAITVSPSNPQVGQTTEFRLQAFNNTQSVWFTNFWGSSNWQLSDSYVFSLSDTEAFVRLTYLYGGQKSVSVQVNSGNQVAVCSLQTSAN